MKITNIEQNGRIFTVTFTPNKLEKFLGVEEKIRRFKETGNYYPYGGGDVYLNEEGKKLGNGNWIGESIDKWKRRF